MCLGDGGWETGFEGRIELDIDKDKKEGRKKEKLNKLGEAGEIGRQFTKHFGRLRDKTWNRPKFNIFINQNLTFTMMEDSYI